MKDNTKYEKLLLNPLSFQLKFVFIIMSCYAAV